MKELNFQEQAFAALYLESFNAREAARGAGYAESVVLNKAWSWVSLTSCPPNKRHVREYIHAQVKERFGDDDIDAEWLLKRCRLLVEFNIKKFLRLDDKTGDMVYDFRDATDDDWYCVEEYVTEQIMRQIHAGVMVPVDKLKIKTSSKIAALKLIGEHTKIQAFRENVNVTGEMVNINMNPEEYKEKRREMLDADDC